MRKSFPGYYRPSDEDFSKLWADCIFSLDANILLNLYRYTPNTREELLGILKLIRDRLWVSHQAAEEYQRNRLNVILKQEKAYEELQKILDVQQQKIEADFRSIGKHPFLDANNLQLWLGNIEETFKNIKNKIGESKKSHPELFGNDVIRNELTAMLDGKVGKPYNKEELDKIFKDGKTRYENKIPPGWKDIDKSNGNIKDSQKYGDLILWLQIIDKAKADNKNVIFVTDDRKDDWWWKIEGRTIGPHPELVKEFYSKTGLSFYMYQADPFMEYARKYLDHEIDQTAIDEVKEIRKHDEERKITNNFILKKEPSADEINKNITFSWMEVDTEDENELKQIIEKISQRLMAEPNLTEERAQSITLEIAGDLGIKHDLKVKFGNLRRRQKSLFDPYYI